MLILVLRWGLGRWSVCRLVVSGGKVRYSADIDLDGGGGSGWEVQF